jgi:hypothetical protein
MHTIAFGVVDVGDGLFSSALYIDAIDVTPVPEVGAFLCGALVCGVIGLAAGVRRLRG